MEDEGARSWDYPKYPDNSTTIQADQPIQLRWTHELNEFTLEYIRHANITRMDLWLVDTQSRSKIHQLYSQYDLSIICPQRTYNTFLKSVI